MKTETELAKQYEDTRGTPTSSGTVGGDPRRLLIVGPLFACFTVVFEKCVRPFPLVVNSTMRRHLQFKIEHRATSNCSSSYVDPSVEETVDQLG